MVEAATLDPAAQFSPEVMQHLEQVPQHVAEQLGALSLQFTHEAQYVKTEQVGEYGIKSLEADFSQVITDPEYDRSELAQDAIEAAEQGQQEAARIMTESAKTIGEAHAKLEADGMVFGTSELETDEERDSREIKERAAIYDAAYQATIDKAVTAKENGDTDQAVVALESLVVLASVEGKIGRSVYEQDRSMLRQAVRAGLGEELLSAAQASAKIFIGEYKTLSGSLQSSTPLLEYATGKHLSNRDFSIQGDGLPSETPIMPEEIKDVLAAISTKDSAITESEAFERYRSSSILQLIQKNIVADAAPTEPGSIEYMYQLAERDAQYQTLEEVLACVNPKAAMDAAEQLELPAWQVISMLGRKEAWNDPTEIDTVVLAPLVELKKTHPDKFEIILESLHSPRASYVAPEGGGIGFDPSKVSAGLDTLEDLNLDQAAFVTELIFQADTLKFTDNCAALAKACQEATIDSTQLEDMLGKSGKELSTLFTLMGDKPEQLADFLSDVQVGAELHDAYVQHYESLTYPPERRPPSLGPEGLSHMMDRITKLGLPEDVASAVFTSWATYNAFSEEYFSDDEWHMPQTKPETAQLEQIAKVQIEAMVAQLHALEDFTQTNGIEATQDIIKTFGIYNFSRYDATELAEQRQRWHAGESPKTVIVNARADWNSYTGGKSVRFLEGAGEGVFHFEANSGRDAARIAISIGQRERANGREPDVQQFILHAHGNADLLLMGVNNEKISTEDYRNAAAGAKRIGAREVNDYTKHLGKNFEVILQSCQTANKNIFDAKNIAQTISERHAAEVVASDVSIHGITIAADGSVTFGTTDNDGSPVIYNN